ncbi:MAG: flavin reductase family protein [Clostridia bacterium]|nr:flavin reductase family protein [Clostridia bacterium]
MNNYREISPEELDRSPFRLIGKEWMLITAADKTKESGANAMTASWGGLGVLWNRPVATVYIRPQRYTYKLTEDADRLSLCFLSEKYKKALSFCGTKSGRDRDKLRECGLTVTDAEGVPAIAEADVIMVCKKLYADDLKEEKFIDRSHLSHYDGDFHRFYILEIEKILVKQ